MSNHGMSIHSISSFNETEAVNYLASVLESHHTIKTFFSSNDKTPNHDGSFELVTEGLAPKKQFIVQIKKVEGLRPNDSGIHKGKYVYQLRTNFLAYVKQRVTESPAIYFVVDITEKRIFWLYLSDQVLMNLDFEGKGNVTYVFEESDILKDIDKFTGQLNDIARERNRMYIDKSPDEIEKLQQAVDYINGFLDHDLIKIKNSMFPNLWRFGIQVSNRSDLSITFGDTKIQPEQSTLIALYPQMRGKLDTGVREYYHDDNAYFNLINLTGKEDPLEYSKNTLRSIITQFFEGAKIPLECLPDIILKEIISVFVAETARLYGKEDSDGALSIQEIELRFYRVAQYIQHLLTEDVTENCEIQIRNSLIRRYNHGERNFCGFADFVAINGGKNAFVRFCAATEKAVAGFSPKLFELMKVEYIQYFLLMDEMKKRKIQNVEPVWNYSLYELRSLPIEEFVEAINIIVDEWLGMLPSIYNYAYSRMFSTDKFKLTGKYVYRNGGIVDCERVYLTSIIHYYDSASFEVARDDSIEHGFEKYREKGVLSIHSGMIFDDFMLSNTPYYSAMCCLLYEGICKGLDLKPEGLHILRNHGRGLLLFA